MTPEANFRALVPVYAQRLASDFPSLSKLDVAAIFGNAGHESRGLMTLQEIKPTVAGSRGGFGWMQWTGPRRRAFETFAKRIGLDPTDPEANYRMLVTELKGDERRAIGAVRAAVSLNDKVVAFEAAFLRAGIKHYPERQRWAQIALDAIERRPAPSTPAPPEPAPMPAEPAVENPAQVNWLAALLQLILSLFKGRPK